MDKKKSAPRKRMGGARKNRIRPLCDLGTRPIRKTLTRGFILPSLSAFWIANTTDLPPMHISHVIAKALDVSLRLLQSDMPIAPLDDVELTFAIT